MVGSKRFRVILDALDIRSGDVIFLHSSFKYISYLGLTPEQILEIVIERLGDDGTLVLPSYAWNLDKAQRPWKGYRNYFRDRPIFDVKTTPANIGWIPEVFRMMPEVERSQSYWWSICARGRLSREFTFGQEKIKHPFGKGSSFDLLKMHGVKILGLGVSLNTNSLVLILDYMFGDRHPHNVFTDKPQIGIIVDENGKHIETSSYWLLPEVVRVIKPYFLIKASKKIREALHRVDEDRTIHFSYPFEIYFLEALRLGEICCSANRALPWLKNYPLRR